MSAIFGSSRRDARRSPLAGAVALIVILWLVIGAAAAGQRHYFSRAPSNCASVSTIIVTIVAGPLNYVGANPKIHCTVPQPSR